MAVASAGAYKQFAPRCRQITTPTNHHSFLQAGCSPWHPTNSVKELYLIHKPFQHCLFHLLPPRRALHDTEKEGPSVPISTTLVTPSPIHHTEILRETGHQFRFQQHSLPHLQSITHELLHNSTLSMYYYTFNCNRIRNIFSTRTVMSLHPAAMK